jgi:hypothetical protein
MSDEGHSEDIVDLAAELKRREVAYQFMSQQLARYVHNETVMKLVLDSALVMIDRLLSDLRLAGGTPSEGLIAAHDKFKATMKKLLEER